MTGFVNPAVPFRRRKRATIGQQREKCCAEVGASRYDRQRQSFVRNSSMANGYQGKPIAESIVGACKRRLCLLCRTAFMSAWSGERICQKCKTRSAWREGFDWSSGGRAA
ncbi:MAG: hypothetical protein ACREE7_19585 [Dongiaceae bacterium]